VEINLGIVIVQVSSTQLLGIFWAVSVFLAFNAAYILFLKDRGSADITKAKILFTCLIGSLIMIGTYADTLAHKPFAMKDCLLLALVAAHGWMAEELVQSFVKKAAKERPGPPTT